MTEQIFVKKIALTNFRGIAEGDHEFAENDFIHGAFGSGKSSFYNAYKWVFGLNVDFAPNVNGKKLKGVETAVEVTMGKGYAELTFKRVARQTWKPSEDGEERFDKYKYTYSYNGIELKAKDYAEAVMKFFEVGSEIELNILLDFQYFNRTAEPKWNAEKRRAYLFDLFNIAAATEELCKNYPLIYGDLYTTKLTQEQLRKGIKAKRDGIKQQIAINQAFIAESTAKLAELETIDFAQAESDVQAAWDELNSIERTTAAEERLRKHEQIAAEIQRLRINKLAAASEHGKLVLAWQNRKTALEKDCADIKARIVCCDEDIQTRKGNIENLDIARAELEATAFDEDSSVCPVCRRKLSPTVIEKKKAYFEEEKRNKLDGMAHTKALLSEGIAEVEKRKKKLESDLDEYVAKYKTHLADEPGAPDTSVIDQGIGELTEQLQNLKSTDDDQSAERKAELKEKISALNAKLARKSDVEQYRQEIDKRKSDNLKLATADAELARQRAQLEEFAIAEINHASNIINNAFGGGVKFNFVTELGGTSETGIHKTCVATLNGIEYDNLSGGQQIICDFIVSRALRKINKWKAPQWTDEVCRVSNSIDRLQEVFDFDLNEWQNIVLLTDDYATLPVKYVQYF